MRTHMHLLALLIALGATPEEAHQAGERTHAVSAMRLDSAIESLNQGTVQVFGVRRELKCPGGGQISESACNPCTYKTSEWAERPAEQWIVDLSWKVGDEAEHAATVALADHYKRYFDLEPRGGVEKGGRRYLLFELKGPRAVVVEDPVTTTLRLAVAGKEATLALVPAGKKDVEIEAKPLGKAGSGALVEIPNAEARFESSCASLVASGPRAARVALHPGVERCEVKAFAQKGGANASIVVRREVEIFVTCEGQRADSLVLEGANVIDLSFEVSPKEVHVTPEWSAEGGKLEVRDAGRNVTLRLEPAVSKATVRLLDRESGAAGAVEVRRKQAH